MKSCTFLTIIYLALLISTAAAKKLQEPDTEESSGVGSSGLEELGMFDRKVT